MIQNNKMRCILALLITVFTILFYLAVGASAQVAGSAELFVKTAANEVNYVESEDGSTKYGLAFGNANLVDWDTAFVSWCANKAGVSTDVIPNFTDAQAMQSFFRSKGLYAESYAHGGTYAPKAGDIAFLSLTSDPRALYSVGIVEDYSYGEVTLIEGNAPNRVRRNYYDDSNKTIIGYGAPQFLVNSPDTPINDTLKYDTGIYQLNENMILLSDPTANAEILTVIPKGILVLVDQISGVWGHTSYNDFVGWMSLEFSKVISDAETKYAIGKYRTDYRLNFRSAPKEDAENVIGAVPAGTIVTVTEISSTYGKTEYEGQTGWLSLEYCTYYNTVTYNYAVTYNASGGAGAPSAQTKVQGKALNLSSIQPTKSFTISYNANGGNVSPASKSVNCSFRNWNTAKDGSGTSYAPGASYTKEANLFLYAQWTNPYAGTLATPTRNGYSFAGWYSAASGGTKITADSTITGNCTLYAHWEKVPSGNGYNLGEETYGFENYGDSDSPFGHCFGMSISSSAYYLNLLDITKIGLTSCQQLNNAKLTKTVKAPICYYQKIQGSTRDKSTVAGGYYYLYNSYNTTADWAAVINYVRDHSFDNKGSLQVAIRNEEGGHAINFLRYENVNGQDRIYVYDNNFPARETYLYKNDSGKIVQAPVSSFNKPIRCIALRNVKTYFMKAKSFDVTHAIYGIEGQISIAGSTYSYMEGTIDGQEYVMYEIPPEQETVKITPLVDNAVFVYLDTEYSFGEIDDNTYGSFTLARTDEDAVTSEPTLIVKKESDNKPGDADGDGKLTSADARLALRASVGLKEKGDVEKDSAAYLACDVDGDGKVTSADARLILRASVGLEDASKFGKKA